MTTPNAELIAEARQVAYETGWKDPEAERVLCELADALEKAEELNDQLIKAGREILDELNDYRDRYSL